MTDLDVDESSISAPPVERRSSLEKHLLTRPEAQDLKDRHILLDSNVAPCASPLCVSCLSLVDLQPLDPSKAPPRTSSASAPRIV